MEVFTRHKRESGFTLVEIMVVAGIVGLVALLAITQFQPQIAKTRTKAVARTLRADLQKAKLEAIKRNSSCLVVFTVASAGNTGSYRTCIDNNDDDDCDDAGDTIISQLDFDDYASVEFQSYSGDSTFIFNSRGIPEDTGGGFTNGTAVIRCTSDASYSVSVILSRVGRVKIE